MSQSKMSVTDTEKKFVIKHVFNDIGSMKSASPLSTEKRHFGIVWNLDLCWLQNFFVMSLKANKENDPTSSWSIDAKIDVLTFKINTSTHKYSENSDKAVVMHISFDEYQKLAKDNIPVELKVICQVGIKKMTGFEKKKLRNFDKESAEKFSDVVLVVGGEKFYVLKKFLASHSTYFESLLLGNFSESQKSEIELKDIDPAHFQNYLDLISGDSELSDDTVEDILPLADFFDSISAIKRCEDFMMNRSELPLKAKFNLAIKCHLDELKKKCILEMKSKEDVESVIPEDPHQFDPTVWAELFKKVVSFK